MTANQRTHACGANELIQHLTYPDCLKYESDDIEWHLPVSLRAGVGGVHKGRLAVTALLDEFMTIELYCVAWYLELNCCAVPFFCSSHYGYVGQDPVQSLLRPRYHQFIGEGNVVNYLAKQRDNEYAVTGNADVPIRFHRIRRGRVVRRRRQSPGGEVALVADPRRRPSRSSTPTTPSRFIW